MEEELLEQHEEGELEPLEEPEPWEQREGEDAQWYARFLHYLNQPKPRRFRATYEYAGYGSKTDRYSISQPWRRHVNAFEWEERVEAYDIDQENARRERHLRLMEKVVDELHDGALEAAKTIVKYARTDRKKAKISCEKRARVHLAAACEVLDRLGRSKLAPSPMYPEVKQSQKKVLEVRIVGADTEVIAGWDDQDD